MLVFVEKFDKCLTGGALWMKVLFLFFSFDFYFMTLEEWFSNDFVSKLRSECRQ